MLKKIVSILLLACCFSTLSAQKSEIQPMSKFGFFKGKRTLNTNNRRTENHSKVVAASLNISLGLFGVHRLYLGTSPQVPVIYTLSLGGGGFLVLTDLGVILFTKNLEQYANEPHVIMWAESNNSK